MSLIQVARYSDVKYDFKDGYACVPVLEGAFDQARFAHCALQTPLPPTCTPSPSTTSSSFLPRARAM